MCYFFGGPSFERSEKKMRFENWLIYFSIKTTLKVNLRLCFKLNYPLQFNVSKKKSIIEPDSKKDWYSENSKFCNNFQNPVPGPFMSSWGKQKSAWGDGRMCDRKERRKHWCWKRKMRTKMGRKKSLKHRKQEFHRENWWKKSCF